MSNGILSISEKFVGDIKFEEFYFESLILAQDERWRRA